MTGTTKVVALQADCDCGSDFLHTNPGGHLSALPFIKDAEEQLEDGTIRNFVIYG